MALSITITPAVTSTEVLRALSVLINRIEKSVAGEGDTAYLDGTYDSYTNTMLEKGYKVNLTKLGTAYTINTITEFVPPLPTA